MCNHVTWMNQKILFLNFIYTRYACLGRVWRLETSLSKTKLVGQFWLLKFDFLLVTKSTQENLKQSQFFKIMCFETSLSYHPLTYRPRFEAAWKELCIACIHSQKRHNSQQHAVSLMTSSSCSKAGCENQYLQLDICRLAASCWNNLHQACR